MKVWLVLFVLSLSEAKEREKVEERCSAAVKDLNLRFDCIPNINVTKTGAKEAEKECIRRGCCWSPVKSSLQRISGPVNSRYPESRYPIFIGAPPCFFPDNYPANYEYIKPIKSVSNNLEKGEPASVLMKNKILSPFAKNINQVRIDVYPQSNSRLRIKISDADNERYEVPIPVLSSASDDFTNPSYHVTWGNTSGFVISRKDTGETIFDATVGEFIFADQFIQLSALLSTKLLFGLSQSHDTFARSFDWQKCPLYASLLFPDYGSHPFYLAMEKSGKSHGVFLFNSNAMDVILQPSPAITYRVTGGILDFYFFLGPTPEEVIQQYTQLIGLPSMVPYWSLGFHLSRYNYGSLNETKAVWARNREAGIPYDVQWNDIDYMDTGYKIFTYNPVTYDGLPGFINTLHDVNMKYVCITDAGIAATPGYKTYDRGIASDIFIKNQTGDLATGTVWPEVCVFVDFLHDNASTYWNKEFGQFHSLLPFDGAWIDMNEITTFSFGSVSGECPHTEWDDPPYVPDVYGNNLAAATICLSSQQQKGVQYNLHNLYGFSMTIHTRQALEKKLSKRAFVLSRSTAPGHGKYGAHWTGDVYSSWDDLQQVIPSILNINLFGIPMVGSDICGFRENTTFELCQRWTQLGAFSPFARNHNDKDTISQDPAAFGEEMIRTFKNAFTLRYELLPFIYTQFYRTQTQGGTVIRPLFFEFPNDNNTYLIQDQFLWGRALMIMPILTEGAKYIEPYFPQGVWYFWPNISQPYLSNGSKLLINLPDSTQVTVAIRGGSIIPTQAANQTTYESRKNKFNLIIGLDDQQTASGDLFWDDGVTIDTVRSGVYSYINFNVSQNALWSTVIKYHPVTDTDFILNKITLMGLSKAPSSITIGNDKINSFTYSADSQSLILTDLSVALSQSFSINWIF